MAGAKLLRLVLPTPPSPAEEIRQRVRAVPRPVPFGSGCRHLLGEEKWTTRVDRCHCGIDRAFGGERVFKMIRKGFGTMCQIEP